MAAERVLANVERELVDDVDLCLPDGRLNPAAKGWSRRPLHRANLRVPWGRAKRWDYWAILAGDLVVSSVYADVDYIGLADVWWVDLSTQRTGGRGIVAPAARGIELPERPGTAPLRVRRRNFELAITDDASGATRIQASWRERNGTAGALDATIELPDGHQSVNVVIPWDDRRFQYTSKHQARPACGTLTVGDHVRSFDDAWGVLDVGRGRWPYSTRWNWGGGAGRVDTGEGSSVVGLQIGGKWTAGTGFTENGVIVDGVVTKLGAELTWDYSWSEPLRPWRVEDPAGRLHIELVPRYDKHTRVSLGVMSTETHQVFGTWSGTIVDHRGRELLLGEVQGFAEESRSRW
ncbi:MAG TPA: DUF2804 domain-containing protein [Acidimicrobiales bacterium]|nr:DUF2804 domain-containing protein [Acidimicrobiales bacterium]